MKVRDLIKLLEDAPQDAPVCIGEYGEEGYVGGLEMRSLGGHIRLDDCKGGFVKIADVKKHRAVVIIAHEWGELSEPSVVKWADIDAEQLDHPGMYKRLREACK